VHIMFVPLLINLDTHWSLDYKFLRNVVNLFQTIIKNEDKVGKTRGVLCTSSLSNLSSICISC
jgi:hypothetical protein